MWLALVSDAMAVDCATGLLQTFPEDGWELVPVNVGLLGSYADGDAPEDPLRLRDGAGIEVAAAGEVIDEGGAYLLQPDGPLAPTSTYELWNDQTEAQERPIFFTTGTEPDLTPPATPVVVDVFQVHEVHGSYGLLEQIVVVLAPPDESTVVAFEALATDTAGEVLERSYTAASGYAAYEAERHVPLGRGPCLVGGTIDGLGQDVTITIRARDWAGNHSEPTEPVTVRFAPEEPEGENPEAPGPAASEPEPRCGCAAVGGAAGWPVAGCVLLLRRRRRRPGAVVVAGRGPR